jgi:hypothetical protein
MFSLWGKSVEIDSVRFALAQIESVFAFSQFNEQFEYLKLNKV